MITKVNDSKSTSNNLSYSHRVIHSTLHRRLLFTKSATNFVRLIAPKISVSAILGDDESEWVTLSYFASTALGFSNDIE